MYGFCLVFIKLVSFLPTLSYLSFISESVIRFGLSYLVWILLPLFFYLTCTLWFSELLFVSLSCICFQVHAFHHLSVSVFNYMFWFFVFDYYRQSVSRSVLLFAGRWVTVTRGRDLVKSGASTRETTHDNLTVDSGICTTMKWTAPRAKASPPLLTYHWQNIGTPLLRTNVHSTREILHKRLPNVSRCRNTLRVRHQDSAGEQ